MKGYKSLVVGKETVLFQNLIEKNYFTEKDFATASSEVINFKNFIDPNIEDFNIPDSPGIQYNLGFSIGEIISKLQLHSMKEVASIYENEYNRKAPLAVSTSWVYYQNKASKNTFWHTHLDSTISTPSTHSGKQKVTKLPNYRTLVIYLQLPEDVEESGRIWFSPNKKKSLTRLNNKISKTDVNFTPKVGDVVIFPGSMPHFPEIHKGDKTRIVLGANLFLEKPKSLI